MTISKELLGLLSIILTAIGFAPYFWSVFKGRTKPHVFTWLIWGVISAVAFAAQHSEEAGAGSWVTGFSAAIYFSIAALAAVWGEKDIKISDWLACLGAMAAVPLWYFTGNPLSAVILVTVIDAFAYFPTFRKSYMKPREEFAFVYILDPVKFIIAMFAMQHYSLVTMISPVFATVADTAFVLMLLWRRTVLPISTK